MNFFEIRFFIYLFNVSCFFFFFFFLEYWFGSWIILCYEWVVITFAMARLNVFCQMQYYEYWVWHGHICDQIGTKLWSRGRQICLNSFENLPVGTDRESTVSLASSNVARNKKQMGENWELKVDNVIINNITTTRKCFIYFCFCFSYKCDGICTKIFVVVVVVVVLVWQKCC